MHRHYIALCLLLSALCLAPVQAQTGFKDLTLVGVSNRLLSGATFTAEAGSTFTVNGTMGGSGTFDLSNGTLLVPAGFRMTLGNVAQGGATAGQVLKWNGTTWVPQDAGGNWGSIIGTVSEQTDLITYLNNTFKPLGYAPAWGQITGTPSNQTDLITHLGTLFQAIGATSTWTPLSGGTSMAVGGSFYDSISANRTLTFTGTLAEGQQILTHWTVTGTPRLTFPTSRRDGQANEDISYIDLKAGLHWVKWEKIGGVIYVTDTISEQVNLATDVSGILGHDKGGAGTRSGILKADGAGAVSAATAGTDYLAPSGSATVTDKTIDGDDNTVQDLAVGALKATTVVTEAEGIASNDNDTTFPTSAAVKAYADSIAVGASQPGTMFPWDTADLANKPTNSLEADGTNGTVDMGAIASGNATWLVKGYGTAATPSASPAAGSYAGAQSVTLTSATSSSQIRYTTNGVDPTPSDTLYSTPVSITSTGTLKAKTFKTLYEPSAVFSAAYVIGGLKTNLVAYYPLDEASGSALDSHTGAKTLTVTGTVGAGSGGPLGAYRSFGGGTGNYLSRTDSAFRPGSSSFSACGWAYMNSTGQSNFPVLFGVTDNSTNREWWVLVNTSNQFSFSTSTTGSATGSNVLSSTWSAATWYFVAAVWDGTDLKLSINGAAFTTVAYAGPVFGGTTAFKIGALGTASLAGRMAGVGYWSGRALTLTEIQQIYNSGAGLPFSSW